MITDGLLMLGVLLALACGLIVLERATGWKLFRYVPAMVLMYLLCAALNSLGVFGEDEATRAPIAAVKDVALPAMIFLFLFGCNLKRIIRLGPKLLLTYAVSAASLFVGMVLIFLLFQAALHPESWKVLGALLASWTGGSANMVAVQDILQAPQNIFGYALITDTLVYSIWLTIAFSSVGFARRFDRFTKATSTQSRDDVDAATDEHKELTLAPLAVVTFGAVTVSILATWIGDMLPELGDVVNGTTWTIVIVSVLGLIIAQTRLGKIAGSNEIATLMLFIVIGQIAADSDFSAITQAPLYLLVGALVIIVHLAIMVIYAKISHTDLFSIAVSSTANIGGIASAPVVAGAYSRQLVPVGVLMALMGSFLGTFLGLLGAKIMGAL